MRVAILTDNDFNKIIGVTTTLTALIAHAPKDVPPRVYTAAALGSDQPDYLALASFALPIPFYRGMRMYLPKWRQYLNRVREDRTDVIHLTMPGPLGLTALWVARDTGLPLLGSYHTDLGAYTSILSGSERLGNGWTRICTGCMDAACRCSCRRSRRAGGCCRAACRGIGSRSGRAAWTGISSQPRSESPLLRREWGADDQRPVVLYVGRVSREKGLQLLPAMVERLQMMNVRLPTGDRRRWSAPAMARRAFTGRSVLRLGGTRAGCRNLCVR